MVLIGWCGCRSGKFFLPVSVSVDNFDYPYCMSDHNRHDMNRVYFTERYGGTIPYHTVTTPSMVRTYMHICTTMLSFGPLRHTGYLLVREWHSTIT